MSPEDRKFSDMMNPMCETFPRIAGCQYVRYGFGGEQSRIEAICILGLNMINDKVRHILIRIDFQLFTHNLSLLLLIVSSTSFFIYFVVDFPCALVLVFLFNHVRYKSFGIPFVPIVIWAFSLVCDEISNQSIFQVKHKLNT